MTVLQILIGLAAAQRLIELALAQRNAARLLARGGVEVGAGSHRLLLALQIAWLVALAVAVPAGQPPFPALVVLFALLLLARSWVILSLGDYWTTRVIAVPEPLVADGPYRWARHPDYLIATAETALLPMAFGAWEVALVFTALQAVLLAYRVRLEERVLGARALTGFGRGARVKPDHRSAA